MAPQPAAELTVGEPSSPWRRNMSLGRILIVLGIILVVLGLLLTIGEKLPLRLGRLPGDIYVHGKYTGFYFPIVTCILLSVVLSLALWLFRR
jgi:hypothetical protein